MQTNIVLNIVRRNGKWVAVTPTGMITACTCRLLMDEVVEYVTAHDKRNQTVTDITALETRQ